MTLKYQNDTKSYVGLTGLSSNDRYTKHKCSFEYEKQVNAKTLFSTSKSLKITKLF